MVDKLNHINIKCKVIKSSTLQAEIVKRKGKGKGGWEERGGQTVRKQTH